MMSRKERDRIAGMLGEPAPPALKPRDVKHFPPTPPANTAEVLVHVALDEIDDQILADFAATMYLKPSDQSGEQRERSTRAIMQLASLGFAFVNWQRNREALRAL